MTLFVSVGVYIGREDASRDETTENRKEKKLMEFKALASWSKEAVRQARKDWKADQASVLLLAYADAYARAEAIEEAMTSWVIRADGYGINTLTQEHFDAVPGRWEWMVGRGEVLYGFDRTGQRIEV